MRVMGGVKQESRAVWTGKQAEERHRTMETRQKTTAKTHTTQK